jgi:hypothetical protein
LNIRYLVSFKIVDEDIWQPQVFDKLQIHGLEYWDWKSGTFIIWGYGNQESILILSNTEIKLAVLSYRREIQP